MFDDFDGSSGVFNDDEAFDLLRELSANTPEELQRQRAHFRLAIKAGITIQPGNASQMLEFKMKGITGDVSQGGCSAVFPMPVTVGDLYRLDFAKEKLDLPKAFARCVRCRLIRDDTFEAGFSFFETISLPEHVIDQYSSAV